MRNFLEKIFKEKKTKKNEKCEKKRIIEGPSAK